MKINNFILGITVFVCGAVVMVFELLGSRVLGPYFGASIFVWTSLIGVVLGSLSLGYYLGGKYADKKHRFWDLSLVIFLAAVSISIMSFAKDLVLTVIQSWAMGAEISSFVASVLLFFPAGVFLGMVSPYAAKLMIRDIRTSASAVGTMYALSTAGSIAGTFLSGFYLIPNFGTNRLLVILSIVLAVLSLAPLAKKEHEG